MSEFPTLAAPAALRGRRRRWLGTAGAALALALTGASAAHAAEPWGFEQVTPVGKGSGTVSSDDTFQTSPDGNALLHTSILPFADVPSESVPVYVRYVARRDAKAWFNRAVDAPYASGFQGIQTVVGSSDDLSYVMVTSKYALVPGAIEGGSNLYLRNTRTGEYTLIVAYSDGRLVGNLVTNMGTLSAKYVAPDGRSAQFSSFLPLVPGAPDNGLTGAPGLYSWTAADGLRVDSVLPDSEGGGAVGVGSSTNGTYYGLRDSIPAGDGALAHVYFSSFVGGGDGPVYVRTGDETTAVSVSRIPGDPSTPVPGIVQAVSANARYMLFATRFDTRLTESTPTDLGSSAKFLYRYDVTDDSLTYVGAAPTLQIIEMSRDGQTIAFQSPLALSGDAVAGQENVYVWRDGTLRFVSAPESGSTGGDSTYHLRRLSSNGRYLAYTDNSSPLARFGVDNVSERCLTFFGTPGPCDNVYLYDFVEDELECVSCRPGGGPPAGHAGDPMTKNSGATRLNSYAPRIVADDGTVFFASAEGFLPEDGNGAEDVYAYRDGELRLVSRAAQGMRSRFLDATADGKTVFFSTDDPIVGTDNDRSVDIYMTREGAGFPYTAPVVTPPCSGGDCRDPFAPASPLAIAGSVSFAGRGNVDGRPSGSGAVRVSKLRSAIGAGAWLRVRVPAAGRVRVSGPGLKGSSTTAGKAGSYRVAVRLSKRARQKLKNDRRVRVRVTVRFAPKAGRPSATRFAMTFKANSSTKKGR